MGLLLEVPGASCPGCGGSVGYESKEEATCWKIYGACFECSRDRRVGTVSMADIDHRDELAERAEQLVKDAF